MTELLHNAFVAYLRAFPISKGKERLLRLLWQSLSFGSYHRSTKLKGNNVLVHCDLTKWIQRHIYFYGEYEPEACRFWSKRARSSRVILDVGANVGVYSLLAAAANPDAAIYAFEPTLEVFDTLRRNVAANGFTNIFLHQKGVARTTGEAFLHHCGGIDGANEGMNYVSDEPSDAEKILTTSLDDFCGQNGIERIDLMKIDVEGGEFDVLRGAESLLRQQKIAYIFFELVEWAANRGGHSTGGITELLRGFGYVLHKLVNGELTLLAPNETSVESVIAIPAGR